MIRIYFWFMGAPEDRLGGPWWYKDLLSSSEAKQFLEDMKPFLMAYATSLEPFVDHDPMEIRPPKHTRIFRRRMAEFFADEEE